MAIDISPRLKFLESAGLERMIRLDKSTFTIGRRGENDLRINDAYISRNHAEIVKNGEEYTLVDKESKTGTFVNGQRVKSATLKHLDRIQFGNSTYPQIIFLIGDDDLPSDVSIPSQTSMILESFAGKDLSNIKRLLESARMFSGTVNLSEILDFVLDTTLEITGAERAFLVLRDEQGDARFQRGRDREKKTVPEDQFQVTRTILDQVLAKGEKVILTNVHEGLDVPVSDSILNLALRVVICLPLKRFQIQDTFVAAPRQEIIGAIYLDSRTAAQTLSKISQEILDSLANDVGNVIENARLLKESREKERLELELSTAREIQSALLPKIQGSYGSFEACARNLPSRHISGDYYDLIQLSNDRYGFTIADVSGKGVSAAILCSVLQGVLFAEAQKSDSLSTCMENVNQYLVQRSGSSKFVTLFYGVIEPNGRLTFVNAGHNPPYLVRANGGIEEITAPGVILGAFDIAKFPENVVLLEPGDLLFLYTDGITEARNLEGQMLGEEEVRKFLLAHRTEPIDTLLEKVLKYVQNYAIGAPQSDDVSILMLRYSGS
jgi:serine phosphatase RsbU (regulator of sigma subunit)